MIVFSTFQLRHGVSRREFSLEGYYYILATMSRQTLGPTHSPIQLVPGALSAGVNRLNSRISWATLPLPYTSWRGAYLSTGFVFMAWYLVKHRHNFTFTLYLYIPSPAETEPEPDPASEMSYI